MRKVKIECKYYDCGWSIGRFYTCSVDNKVISIDSKLKFIGEHRDGRKNRDVDGIEFNNCELPKIPKDLAKIFPKLKILFIYNSKLKSIERSDLKQFLNLTYIGCPYNEIEYLSGDLFNDTKNLVKLDMRSNKIAIIEPNLLDELENLRVVNFNNNPAINKCWDSIDYDGNATFHEIKNEIKKKFFTPEMMKMYEIKVNLERKFDAHRNGICGDLSKIIQNENLKDFIVTVNDEEFKIHKFLLAARSSVLKEMIEQNIDAKNLNLIDISKEIFHEILKFIYTDELPVSDDLNYVHLYAASQRLKIEKLTKFACEKLMNKINNENALEILTLANKYEDENLRQKSFQKINENNNNEFTALNLARNPDKLKKIIAAKKLKDEMMEQMNMEIARLMNEE